MLVYFALHRERSHLAIVGLLVAAALGAQAFIAFADPQPTSGEADLYTIARSVAESGQPDRPR